MPPRWLSLLIIAFWMGTTGWLLWRDVWPMWRPGEPPAYTIDLTAEVHRSQPRIRWMVFQNDLYVFRAETWVDSPEPDVYALHATAKYPHALDAHVASLGPLHILRMASTYRVNAQGQLLGLTGHVEGEILGYQVSGDVSGEVREGQFFSHISATGLAKPIELNPVPVSARGSVLVPLHPVNRIQGLHPGQTWRIPVFDPLPAALLAKVGLNPAAFGLTEEGTLVLQAEVLPQTQPLTLHGRDVRCLVIRYRGESAEMTASTWVEEETGLVLRQEANEGDQHWVMQRD
jgi:hypothetical protein